MSGLIAFYRSTIGKKIIMAVTGLIGVGFLVSHVASNLLIFQDPHKLDEYGAFLRSLGALLYAARAGLVLAVVLHVTVAIQLWRRQRDARPVDYQRRQPQVSSLGSRTMRWGGLLLLAFIVFHILHFTIGTVHPDFRHGEVGRNVIVGFRSWPVVVFYVVAMAALGLHLYHGAWASFRTIGASAPSSNPLRRPVAAILAIVLAIAFALIPLGVIAGFARYSGDVTAASPATGAAHPSAR